jgi:quercetin dioxygenase-like cupin family protein
MTRKSIVLMVLFTLPGVAAYSCAQNATAAPNRASEVKFFSPEEVAASFQKSSTLVENPEYRVLTAKREEAGQVEIHTKFLDVFYVLEGNATITVGGKMQGQASTDPDEPRGTSIEGGETHELSPGSVVVIPAGIPHWMSKVPGTFRYFVVKVAEPK